MKELSSKETSLRTLEHRSDKLANDLVKIQDLREKYTEKKSLNWDYKLTLEAYLGTQREIKEAKEKGETEQ